MSSLFEISEELQEFVNLLDDPEVELDEDAFLDTLEGMEGELKDKLEAWAKVIKNKEADIKARKELMDNLKRKNNTDESSISEMKYIMKMVMERAHIQDASSPIIKIKIATNGGVLPLKYAPDLCHSYSRLPERFRKEVTEYSPNTEEIRKALDAGEVLDFVQYGERGTRLDVK